MSTKEENMKKITELFDKITDYESITKYDLITDLEALINDILNKKRA